MIVVTTPTGNIGRHVVRDLADAGIPIRVVARDPDALDADLRKRVEVVHGSHGDPKVIDDALVDADALFWVVPPAPVGSIEEAYSGFTRPAADAVARRGVARVVVVTALGRGTPWENRAGLVTASIRMVDLLNGTGAAVRGLAMPGFMENALMQVETIRQGYMQGPVRGDARLPHTATRDMAKVAAGLLGDPSWSGVADVPVVGPEDLSFDEMAGIVSEVASREVIYRQVPYDEFETRMIGRGASPDFARGYVDMFRAKEEGMDEVAARDVSRIAETSFRRWAREVLGPALAR